MWKYQKVVCTGPREQGESDPIRLVFDAASPRFLRFKHNPLISCWKIGTLIICSQGHLEFATNGHGLRLTFLLTTMCSECWGRTHALWLMNKPPRKLGKCVNGETACATRAIASRWIDGWFGFAFGAICMHVFPMQLIRLVVNQGIACFFVSFFLSVLANLSGPIARTERPCAYVFQTC